MKALILAAGIGSRLAPLTDDSPKSLVPVNGKPIIIKQIENLLNNNITDITVVSGYKGDILEKELKGKFPFIKIIYSIDYLTTNNMYSAYLAKENLLGNAFLMMNADVFFDESVIHSLLAFDFENAIVTDIDNYNEESMKVVQVGESLSEISKIIKKENALGSSIDVYKFSAAASCVFFEVCDYYIEEKKELKLWSEVALNEVLKKVEFRACPLDGRWFEIDNLTDLENASKLFATEV